MAASDEQNLARLPICFFTVTRITLIVVSWAIIPPTGRISDLLFQICPCTIGAASFSIFTPFDSNEFLFATSAFVDVLGVLIVAHGYLLVNY